MATEFIDIWVNCPDQTVAREIGDRLVEERLAACANIFPAIASTYRWKGAVEHEDEVPLLLKSRWSLFPVVSERVKVLHPYEQPSIVACELPLVETGYAEWLARETLETA